ncbi:Tn3 family transposase [Arthrobacter sp. KBS0703]|nr:Tn3 family transposase [Arthrobacter sp. KBS0703]TSE16030.1 Tn3 family transposase [Arthrobacter sp. KBS0703]
MAICELPWSLQGRSPQHTLARAVFFNRLGKIRDRSFEQQRYRASGLNLLTAGMDSSMRSA